MDPNLICRKEEYHCYNSISIDENNICTFEINSTEDLLKITLENKDTEIKKVYKQLFTRCNYPEDVFKDFIQMIKFCKEYTSQNDISISSMEENIARIKYKENQLRKVKVDLELILLRDNSDTSNREKTALYVASSNDEEEEDKDDNDINPDDLNEEEKTHYIINKIGLGLRKKIGSKIKKNS